MQQRGFRGGWGGLFAHLTPGGGHQGQGAYRAVDTDEDDGVDAASGVVGVLSSGYAHYLRSRFGSAASTALWLSLMGVLFIFAVLGDEFSTSSVAAARPTGAAPVQLQSNSTVSAPTLAPANATTAAASATTSTSHQRSDLANKRSSIFYWTLALATLVVLLAIVRSLVLLRRALSERTGRISPSIFSVGRGGLLFNAGVVGGGGGGGGMRRGLSFTDLVGGNLGTLRSHLSLMGREITENDFEALTQLDAINQLQDSIGRGRNSGASEHMIDRLPLHTMSAAEVASKAAAASDGSAGGALTTCAVCMEPFEEGCLARTVPCMHIFHQNCIDPWLRLHASCPICKHSILQDDDAVF